MKERHPTYSHVLQSRNEVSASLKGIPKIYLDTNYWIKLQQQNGKVSGDERELLDLLTQLVSSGKCVVPVSDIIYMEVMKQEDLQSLMETASMIDRLSQGMCLIGEQERIQMEFLQFAGIPDPVQPNEPLRDVWTTLPLVVLYDGFARTMPNQLNADFIDFISGFSFCDILRNSVHSGNHSTFRYKDNVDAFNEDKVKYAHENSTYEQLFLSELGGFLQGYETVFAECLELAFYEQTGHYPTAQEREKADIRWYCRHIYELFRRKEITTGLPATRIFSEMFASVRWNTTRKYKDGNDTIDFKHACAALPYFDYFFTERELKTMITQRRLDALYSCHVESNSEKVLAVLTALQQKL